MKKILLTVALIGLLPISCNNSKQEITILYTNDVHGYISNNLSYSNIGQMKKDLKNQGKNVLLLDSGDHISGGVYTSYDNGNSIIDLMNMAGYDAATFGNHEFDYDFKYLKQLMNKAKYPYVCANFFNMKDGVPTTRFSDASKIFTFGNTNVGVIGVATPTSITTSTPAHFQDEKGNYIYTFMENYFYKVMQEEINILKEKCDYVICLSHLGDEDKSTNFTSSNLIKKTTGLDAVLDGHTHQCVPAKYVKDKNGKEVLITQTGSSFNNVGKLTITPKGKLINEFISYYPYKDDKIAEKEVLIEETLYNKFKGELATSNINFEVSGYHETNLGDLVAEAAYYYYNVALPSQGKSNYKCDFTFVNSGGIRTSVKDKLWRLFTCFQIHSFGNASCVKEVSAKQVRQALEFSVRNAPNDYFGGFQQLCGIRFKVNTNIKTDIKVDGTGAWISGPSVDHQRVEDIEIFNKENNSWDSFDESETKTYRIGGSAYVLNSCGDGLAMLKKGNVIYQDPAYVDYQILAEYIKNFKHEEGVLPEINAKNSPLVIPEFSNLPITYKPTGADRITFIQ